MNYVTEPVRIGASRVIPAVTGALTVAMLPAFMTGALAVYIRDDLQFSISRLGVSLAVFSLSATILSLPCGVLVDRLGARRTILASITVSGVVLILMGSVAVSWFHLTLLLAVGGSSIAIAGPAANVALLQGISRGRQGTAFGLKQAGGPLGTLIAGSSVPLLATRLGWRWTFIAVGIATLSLLLVVPRQSFRRRPSRPATDRDVQLMRAPLLWLAGAAALGVGSANAMSAFFVESGVAAGLHPSQAGTVLAVGGLSGVVARILYGWSVDRWAPETELLRLVQWLMIAGTGGYVALSGAGSMAIHLIGAFLAFAVAWGWPGLLTLAVARRYAAAPAVATSYVTAGMSAGGMGGPLIFGAAIERWNFTVAWLGLAVAVALAAACVRTVRQLLNGASTRVNPSEAISP